MEVGFLSYLSYIVYSNSLFLKAEKDPSVLQNRFSEAVAELKVLQRSAIVNQLYGGRQLAVEDPPTKDAEATMERGQN